MWVFGLDSSSIRFVLLAGQDYDLGRQKPAIFSMGADSDQSLSRRHAKLKVAANEVTLTDLNSTFGTYVGDDAINTSGNSSQVDRLTTDAVIKRQDTPIRIRFGLGSTIFTLAWQPVLATSSSLTVGATRDELKKCVAALEGELTSQWSDQVTHVVMDQIILTIKVVNALSKGIPIVTPNFFTDVLTAAKTKQPLPTPVNYVPKLNETSLNAEDISCGTKTERGRLFEGRTFIFSHQSQRVKYADAIRYASGDSVAADDCDGELPYSANDVANGNVVVISPDVRATKLSSAFKNLQTDMAKKSLSLIPESAIGLAILKISCKTDFNPRKKPLLANNGAGTVHASQSARMLLAPDTQMADTMPPPPSTPASRTGATSSMTKQVPETLSARSRPASSRVQVEQEPSEESEPVPSSSRSTRSTRSSKEPSAASESISSSSRSTRSRRNVSQGKRARCEDEEQDTLIHPAAKVVKSEVVDEAEEEEMEDDLFSVYNPGAKRAEDKRPTDGKSQVASRRSPRKSVPDTQVSRGVPTQLAAKTGAISETQPSQNDAHPTQFGKKKTSVVNETVLTGAFPTQFGNKDQTAAAEEERVEAEPEEEEEEVDSRRRKATPPPSPPNKRRRKDSNIKENIQEKSLDGWLSRSIIKKNPDDNQNVLSRLASANDTTVDDLTRSYVNLVVKPLVMPRRPKPTYTPDSTTDLHRPVKNFKRFKKQLIRSQQQAAAEPIRVVAGSQGLNSSTRERIDEWSRRQAQEEQDRQEEQRRQRQERYSQLNESVAAVQATVPRAAATSNKEDEPDEFFVFE